MPEQQNIEYKQSWHDDYLKWVCGFANAHGGVIHIGKDDHGKVVGVSNHKKLLDEIPNKIRNQLGIIAEVNLKEENGLPYIEIITQPYTVPVSLRGRYYYRSGSTKMELTGNALIEFLLKKSGKTWDDVVEPSATFVDIAQPSVNKFLQVAGKSGRMPDVSGLSLPELFEKLRLTDNGELKRAAIILFGKDPGRFYPNMTVKIGRFGKNDTDLRFQETVEGNLFYLLQEVPAQLNRKFFTKPIDFEGLLRIEKDEYPVAAVREMLLNALIHRNYMGAMIQIRMYDDKFSIWNEGLLPEGLTVESLKKQHASRPRNPIIANVCFMGGYIDHWGRGTLKVIEACREANLPEPDMKEQDGGFSITIFKNKFTEDQLKKSGLNDRQLKAVLFVKEHGSINNSQYQELVGVAKATASRDLAELTDKWNLLEKQGRTGVGTIYVLKNS